MGSLTLKLVVLALVTMLCSSSATAAGPPEGMVVGSVSQPLSAADGSEYLIFLPTNWTSTTLHPILVFLHGVGGINNAGGCRNPGLITQFPLLDPEYAAGVEHIVIVPVARRPNWRHHFESTMALLDMALSDLAGDPDRVSIAGQSMGGHGAYLFASQLAPDRFCAVVAICAYLDEEDHEVSSMEASATSEAEDGTIPDGGGRDYLPLEGKAFSDMIMPLRSTPVWLFHSEEDDIVPPPGHPQDDGSIVAKALELAGNTKVKYTRYVQGKTPPNYIPGHAAFEFAFHEDTIWPWLSAQKRPPVQNHNIDLRNAVAAVVGVVIIFIAIILAGRSYDRLPSIISSVALLVSSLAFLGLMQSEGGLIDSCHSYSFVDVTADHCRDIGAALARMGEAERGWLAMAISKARAENCFALGMGTGAIYSLLYLRKGTREVAVVHLMHATWAVSVFVANAQNAAVLLPFGVSPEANIDAAHAAKLVPFAVIVGLQAFLDICALTLSLNFDEANAKEKIA